jgi:tetratricopeptide (TPR) repeat protein
VARLAEGLAHAHERGILHRDVKPSNVLIAADGQPLLLDFNLSQDQAADPAEAVLGGTVAYMAPEHLRAMARRSAPASLVDERSDLYSLGMVLYEMLTGRKPFEQSGSYSVFPLQLEAMATERSKVVPTARQLRSDVPWGLESIVRRCLAPEPADRYQRAEHLAEDLCRFLDDRPLRHAPELSRAERLAKWARRHPRLTQAACVCIVAGGLLLAVGGALAASRSELFRKSEQLDAAQAVERRREFERAAIRAQWEPYGLFEEGARECERALGVYGVLDSDGWDEPREWRRLARPDRDRLAGLVREVLMILAAVRVRLAPGDTATLRGALDLLARAEVIQNLPPSRALWLDRARYLAALGEPGEAADARRRAEAIPVASAQEHYLLAAALARSGTSAGRARALAELDRAVALDPDHYWAWLLRGICHAEMGRLVSAAGDFGRCAGLLPDFAWGHLALACVQEQAGDLSAALDNYGRALACDPGLVPARRERGRVLLQLKRHAEALADFDRALEGLPSDPTSLAGRDEALEGLCRHAEADAAFGAAFATTGVAPVIRRRMRLGYGFAVAARLPRQAGEAFEEVLRADGRHAQALYGLAMLAMQRSDAAAAVRLFDRALEGSPQFADARRYRAVALARLGEWTRAGEDVRWCLQREPGSGASLYAAACVASLESEKRADLKQRDRAFDLLRRALERGAGRDRLADDPDLAPLRADPRFARLRAGQTDHP